MELVYYRNWWLLSLKGVALIVLGILAFIFPINVIIGLALYVGILVAISGLLLIIMAFSNRDRSQWPWILVLGMFDVVLGAFLVFYPLLTAMAFAIITGFWAVFTGVLQIAAFFSIRKVHSSTWSLLLVTGILVIVLGMNLIWSPFIGAVALTYLLGFEAILVGVMSIIYSLRLRQISSTITGGGPFQYSH
ncbi:HdeD family acid-resistance protein [Pontibacter ruber]|uniref:HdeD family acid-resistance protein n=1 Tax=Pontibacter ruber TaxID=1343895 RepID=A0ABW5D227_9BACT|nr:DUF308 domain-containing protein [Pontibacter ruber]